MKSRLLIVSPTPFLPTDAGNRVRIRNMIESLMGMGVDVFVLHVEREQGDRGGMEALLGDERFRSIPYCKPHRQEGRFSRMQRRVRQLADRDLRYVWKIDDWYDPAITDAVLNWHEREAFSAVMVEYVFFSALFEHLPESLLKILDTHDRFTLRHRLYLERGMAPKFFSTTREEEARGLSRADLILAIQEREKAFFSQLTDRPVVTLGHLVAVEDCFVPHAGEVQPQLLIVGSENEINVDGLRHFLAQDWPALKAAFPGSRLSIAGGVGKHLPAELAYPEDIAVLGFVEHLADAYRTADIVVNPVRSGTGLNIKSIEALGYGKPMVTTVSGARGIESGTDSAFLCADTPSEFVGCVQKIWCEDGYASKLSRQALHFAREWNSVALSSLSQVLLAHGDRGLALRASR